MADKTFPQIRSVDKTYKMKHGKSLLELVTSEKSLRGNSTSSSSPLAYSADQDAQWNTLSRVCSWARSTGTSNSSTKPSTASPRTTCVPALSLPSSLTLSADPAHRSPHFPPALLPRSPPPRLLAPPQHLGLSGKAQVPRRGRPSGVQRQLEDEESVGGRVGRQVGGRWGWGRGERRRGEDVRGEGAVAQGGRGSAESRDAAWRFWEPGDRVRAFSPRGDAG